MTQERIIGTELGEWLRSRDARIERVTFHRTFAADIDTIRITGTTPEVPGKVFQWDYIPPRGVADEMAVAEEILREFQRKLSELLKE